MKHRNNIGTLTVEAPSNIALIKYWGKLDAANNWPANDSLSMTLKEARTISHFSLSPTTNHLVVFNGIQLDAEDAKALRITKFLQRLRDLCGMVDAPSLMVDTRNTFPTACGIASSASGMAALTIGAIAWWHDADSFAALEQKGFDRQRLANLARLGSGSSCRSLWGNYVHWHKGEAADKQWLEPQADHFGPDLADIIVMVSQDKKAIGSTEAHQGAWHSPFFKPRLAILDERMRRLKKALLENTFSEIAWLVEQEALELHAIAMTSQPPSPYLLPGSIDVCSFVREQRTLNDLPAFFTIDAGPNIHVLCPQLHSQKVAAVLRTAFPNFELLIDGRGDGPKIYRSAD